MIPSFGSLSPYLGISDYYPTLASDYKKIVFRAEHFPQRCFTKEKESNSFTGHPLLTFLHNGSGEDMVPSDRKLVVFSLDESVFNLNGLLNLYLIHEMLDSIPFIIVYQPQGL